MLRGGLSAPLAAGGAKVLVLIEGVVDDSISETGDR